MLRLALVGVLTYAAFSYLGAVIAYRFSSNGLHQLFAVLLIVLGLRYCLLDTLLSGRAQSLGLPVIKLNLGTMILTGSAIGIAGGLFGIGAGVLMVPLFSWIFRMHKDDARAISLAILVPPVSVGAVLKYHDQGDIIWPMAAVGLCTYLLSNYWGARLGRAHPPRRFHIVMGAILLVLGGLYVVQ